jgi:hypothetical protein
MADSRAKDYHIQGKYLYVPTHKVFAEMFSYDCCCNSPAIRG